MKTHRYKFPEKALPQWGRLSDEAKIALARGAMGTSDAGELLADDISSLEALNPQALAWASSEMNGDSANSPLSSWKRYEALLGSTVPNNPDELFHTNPNLVSTLNRLYEAKQALGSSGETTPNGLNIGVTMHLTLMPWQAMKDHLDDFNEWLRTLRDCQNIATRYDYIHNNLLTTIQSNKPLYRDADNPVRLLTPAEYLNKQIDKDGPWGVMLVQTSNESGVVRLIDASPDEMTDEGTKHLELAGHPIDAMGIFEWIALTMQEDPSKLSSSDYSLLLANIVLSIGVLTVPLGCWNNGGIRTSGGATNSRTLDTAVRVAIM